MTPSDEGNAGPPGWPPGRPAGPGIAVHERRVHDLKCWPAFFQATIEGRKKAEVRKDDRGYQTGDTLLLREWDPVAKRPTGRTYAVRVTHLADLGTIGVAGIFVCLSFVPVRHAEAGFPDGSDHPGGKTVSGKGVQMPHAGGTAD